MSSSDSGMSGGWCCRVRTSRRRRSSTGRAAPPRDWVRRTGGLPTQRIEPTAPTAEPEDRRDGEGETPRVAASLFSGSPEADERGRVFDETSDFENDFARANG